jgi:LPXTG-motif cell wall-anchored protein
MTAAPAPAKEEASLLENPMVLGVAGLLLIGIAGFFVLRRRKGVDSEDLEAETFADSPFAMDDEAKGAASDATPAGAFSMDDATEPRPPRTRSSTTTYPPMPAPPPAREMLR